LSHDGFEGRAGINGTHDGKDCQIQAIFQWIICNGSKQGEDFHNEQETIPIPEHSGEENLGFLSLRQQKRAKIARELYKASMGTPTVDNLKAMI
jgi:hypothetical protein